MKTTTSNTFSIIFLSIAIVLVVNKTNKIEKLIETHEHTGKQVMVCGGIMDECKGAIALYNEKREIVGFKVAE